jgi:hypothetical protein
MRGVWWEADAASLPAGLQHGLHCRRCLGRRAAVTHLQLLLLCEPLAALAAGV